MVASYEIIRALDSEKMRCEQLKKALQIFSSERHLFSDYGKIEAYFARHIRESEYLIAEMER